MADVMKLEVITPDRRFYEGEVTMVELTTINGNIGIYPKHIPMTTVAAPGVLKIHEAEQLQEAALHAGFITVMPDKVTILAEIVEWPDEIDYARAEAARVRAERRLGSNNSGLDVVRAEAALKRALVRLEVRH